MENFMHSSSTLSDFEFKYIPKKEFERIVTRVQWDRKQHRKASDSFSSTKDDDGDVAKVLTDDEIRSVMHSVDMSEIIRRIPASSAPLLGPARRLDVKALEEREQRKTPSTKSAESSETSLHIVEDVKIQRDARVANQQEPIDEVSVCSSIENVEEEEKASLHSEMLKLCDEIENANGTMDDEDSSVDLTYQEDSTLRSIMAKTEEKVICESHSQFIDKRFDFLDDYDDEAQQCLPVVELRKKTTADDDSTNDNNVWSPKAENQISRSGRRAAKRNDDDADVLPSDVIIQKARVVGNAKRIANEKSQVAVKPDESKLRAEVERKADILCALGRVDEFHSKICQYLDYLLKIIDNPPEVEDMDDLKKRQKRATEFSNRFARNHLYQIGRAAEEIRVMPDNPLDLASKVNSLSQVMMQAVQVYLKNVEMFLYNRRPDKLPVLLDFIINAMKVCFDRAVLDKRDLVIQQMLRKCSEMKRFLEMNQHSEARFVSVNEMQRSLLKSRSSTYENPYGSKLSMYNSAGAKPKLFKPTAKTPYGEMKPRKNPTRSAIISRPPSRLNIRSQQSRSFSPGIKKSISNVSTAVQRVKQSESGGIVKTVSEKPYEECESAAPLSDKQKEIELMQMIQSITKEKIQEMLIPLFAKLSAERNEKSIEVTADSNPVNRVTADVPVVKPKTHEKVHRISKNVQYFYVKSTDDASSHKTPPKSSITASSQKPSKADSRLKIVSSDVKPPVAITTKKPDKDITKELKELALKERLNYVSQMMENPLYNSEVHSEPWRMFAGISDQLLDEMLRSVVAEFDFGEETFVENFLRHELEC